MSGEALKSYRFSGYEIQVGVKHKNSLLLFLKNQMTY